MPRKCYSTHILQQHMVRCIKQNTECNGTRCLKNNCVTTPTFNLPVPSIIHTVEWTSSQCSKHCLDYGGSGYQLIRYIIYVTMPHSNAITIDGCCFATLQLRTLNEILLISHCCMCATNLKVHTFRKHARLPKMSLWRKRSFASPAKKATSIPERSFLLWICNYWLPVCSLQRRSKMFLQLEY